MALEKFSWKKIKKKGPCEWIMRRRLNKASASCHQWPSFPLTPSTLNSDSHIFSLPLASPSSPRKASSSPRPGSYSRVSIPRKQSLHPIRNPNEFLQLRPNPLWRWYGSFHSPLPIDYPLSLFLLWLPFLVWRLYYLGTGKKGIECIWKRVLWRKRSLAFGGLLFVIFGMCNRWILAFLGLVCRRVFLRFWFGDRGVNITVWYWCFSCDFGLVSGLILDALDQSVGGFCFDFHLENNELENPVFLYKYLWFWEKIPVNFRVVDPFL